MSNYAESELARAADNAYISEEAEAQAICALLKVTTGVSEKVSLLSEDDFGTPVYSMIFKAIKATVAKHQPVNVGTVSASISMIFKPEESSWVTQGLMGVLTKGGSAAMLDSYAEALKALSNRRKSIQIISEIQKKMYDPEYDLGAVVDEMRTQFIQLQNGKHEWSDMSKVLMNTFEYIEKRSKGEIHSITSGIESVDDLIGGFYGGEMTVIGARPAVGKSAFALNIAYEASKQGFKVGYVSREMTDVQLGSRLLSRESHVNGMKLRKADGMSTEDWERIGVGVSELADLNISFMFTIRNIEDLRREVQRRVEQKQMDILVIDYLQLLDTALKVKEDHLRVARVSKELKQMALDFNIPVIALAQVNRDTDGLLPTLKSLKDSGSIEQDADGVIFLHRPTNPKDPSVNKEHIASIPGWIQNGYDYLVIDVAKQRQGQIGRTCVLFNKAFMRYENIGG